ncbi:MAG: transglutaminase family protein, partial [Myxococcales bacterium]|nr:transglutaminase family protein [Myxococcales bacterium]
MTLHVALHHETRYRYDRRVALGAQTIRLRPAPHCRTPIASYSLRVEPAEHFLNWQQDPQGNFLARVVVPEPCEAFTVTVDLVADMAVINPFDFFLEEEATHVPFAYAPELAVELRPFLECGPDTPRLAAWVAGVPRARAATMDALVALNQRLQREIEYVVRLEPGVQTPEETLALARGSCRDSAWLLVQILRRLGIAARFASGYLIQLAPDVRSLDGPSGPAADFTDLHAWAEAYLPGAGWIGLDPTSGLLAGEGHIPLACSPSPSSAAPISGALEPCEVDFEHAMSVARILETPRVTKPYDEAQWRAIDALGDAIDGRLAAHDVRLTMGGEPTFVSVDDMLGAEWNTEALGPTKRVRAHDLALRLRERFAPGGLLHYGQGKWYPGEPLPRWAFSIHWRDDGVPLWSDPERIADEAVDHAPTAAQARALAEGIASRLDIAPSFVAPAYEDPLHAVAAEAALPENETLDPADPRLASKPERARLARALARGLAEPAAFVLPVQAWNARDGGRSWLSEVWKTRRGHLFLAPGDSPAGFRLPLGSLLSIGALDNPYVVA